MSFGGSGLTDDEFQVTGAPREDESFVMVRNL
jgi:hypothetical protein